MTIWTSLNEIDFAHRWVDADGVSTRTMIAGNGPDVICLHGTSGHLEAFVSNVAPLVNAGFRVHALDMLGHGYTDKPNYDYTISAHVEHLRAYVKQLGIERPHFIGESLGGWAAAWYASEYPDEVGRVVLAAPGGAKADPEVMDRIKSSTEAAVLNPSFEQTRKRLELLMHDPAVVTEELVEVRHAIYTRPDFVHALPHVLCLLNMDTRVQYVLNEQRLAKVKAPTLLFWGHQNPFGEMDEPAFLAEAIPDCKLTIFDKCGHWPQFERADEFNEMVIPFLQADAQTEAAS